MAALHSRILKWHPATLVLGSFLALILLGALALMLPLATAGGRIPFVDALFTATSAVCVTGLTVVDTGTYFTFAGQCVILVLIQIGGLGVMTISVALFRWLGRSVSIRQRMAMQDLFAHTPRQDIFGLLKSVLYFTLGAEAVGAVLLTIHGWRELPFWQALFNGVFHSVSAFCNAGFGLFPDNFMRYSGDYLLNVTLCALIVIGGIGFPVLYDLQSWSVRRRKSRVRLSVQTKTVLLTSLLLIVSGALVFAFLERQSLAAAPSLSQRILAPLFQSITCRTAGFNTVDISSLQDATLAMMIFLMFVGASPGSCGGGVKTTTLALLAAFTLNRVRRGRRVNMFRKSIPAETVTRSVALVLVSLGIIGIVMFLILVGDAVSGRTASGSHGPFLGYLFETVSAFGTVGLSMGMTAALSAWSKCLLIVMMVIGRVGVLAFAYIFVGTSAAGGVEYSEENLMIG
jgi:trk system potassium uptake protein TrkH